MSKLHYCLNGRPVTEQVVLYQKTRESRDYLPIQFYYDDYKDHWFAQLDDYIDRITFESDFDYKLSVAVNMFKSATAACLQKEKGYGPLGAFNGFFYKILSNWKSNIKTSAFRVKRRPAVQCPVCSRMVGRIDEKHLQHFKTISDLPKFMVWRGDIYEVTSMPRVYVVTWGEKTNAKITALKNGDAKTFASCKCRIRWPWKLDDGSKGVLCPFTKNIIPHINEEYLKSLPVEHGRYAPPMTWVAFSEKYPCSLIQSEVYDLHRPVGWDQKGVLQDHIDRDRRVIGPFELIDYDDIKSGDVPISFESAFCIIENFIKDSMDQEILKLIATGYTVDDVASTLEIDKKEVRSRIKSVRSEELRRLLDETV